MVRPVTGRTGPGPYGVVLGRGNDVAFAARGAPQPSDETRRWAFEQFQDLERALMAVTARLADLEGRLDNDTWDG